MKNALAIFSVLMLALSLAFLSVNVTGNVIYTNISNVSYTNSTLSNFTYTNSSFIGAICFFCGLVGSFAYFRVK